MFISPNPLSPRFLIHPVVSSSSIFFSHGLAPVSNGLTIRGGWVRKPLQRNAWIRNFGIDPASASENFFNCIFISRKQLKCNIISDAIQYLNEIPSFPFLFDRVALILIWP